jgi:hypothetical protein
VNNLSGVKYLFFYLIQWYLGIRPLWNKSKLAYVLFGRESRDSIVGIETGYGLDD